MPWRLYCPPSGKASAFCHSVLITFHFVLHAPVAPPPPLTPHYVAPISHQAERGYPRVQFARYIRGQLLRPSWARRSLPSHEAEREAGVESRLLRSLILS